MKTRILGQSGIEVSAIGLGCMGMSQGFGDAGNTNEMVFMLQEANDLGITLFDTAQAYGPYTNEELLGKAFHDRRDKVVLATKCGMYKDDEGKYYLDGSPEKIRSSLEESLKRLQTDMVDIYYLHRLDPKVPVEESAMEMKKLYEEGKIRAWGLSEVDADTIRRANAVFPLSAVESEYNMMWRTVEKEVLPVCRQLNIALVPFSPLAKGFMSGTIKANTKFAENDSRSHYSRFTSENISANQRLIDLVSRFAEKYGITDAQLSLSWLLAQWDQIIPIPGTRKISHLKENIAAAEVKLDPADTAALTEALNHTRIAGKRF